MTKEESNKIEQEIHSIRQEVALVKHALLFLNTRLLKLEREQYHHSNHIYIANGVVKDDDVVRTTFNKVV